MTGQIFYDLTLLLLRDFLQREVSVERNCRLIAELTYYATKPPKLQKITSEEANGVIFS